ncbi:MAG: sugar phosphate isomerase/epimerase [Sphaerochaetaceae bacterium]|nr:sugar phosphate isomerase/epimerase [Sphaerochaetaceae bacterium]
MKDLISRITGIPDEGHPSIDGQIKLHKLLGFDSIELRNIDTVNICRISDKKFEYVKSQLEENNIKCIGLASEIANWGRPISTPFEEDIKDLEVGIKRMKALDTNLIRIMSYPNDNLSTSDWEKETLRRLKYLVNIAESEKVILGMEICDGLASASPQNLEKLLSEIDSPSLKIIFDSGNPISHFKTIEESWKFYQVALDKIIHFHIKDCKIIDNKVVHTYPGLGDCDVKLMVKDILSHGYEGLFSIETHLNFDYLEGMYYKYGNMVKNMMEEISL